MTLAAGALLLVLRAAMWTARLPLALRALLRRPGTAVVRVEGRVLRQADGRPVVSPQALARALRRAAQVFAEQAQVQLEIGVVGVVDGVAPAAALRPPCSVPALVHALSPAGAYLRRQAVPYGLTVFAVDVVAPGQRKAGCSLGPPLQRHHPVARPAPADLRHLATPCERRPPDPDQLAPGAGCAASGATGHGHRRGAAPGGAE